MYSDYSDNSDCSGNSGNSDYSDYSDYSDHYGGELLQTFFNCKHFSIEVSFSQIFSSAK